MVMSDIDEEYEPSLASGDEPIEGDSGSDSYDADNPDGNAPESETESDSESETLPPPPPPPPVVAAAAVAAAAAAAEAPTPVEDEFAGGPGSANQSVPKSTIDAVTLQKIIKSKEEADNARNRMIIIVAIVTTLIVIGVTLGVIFGYNNNSSSQTPVWAQDGASRYDDFHVAVRRSFSPTFLYTHLLRFPFLLLKQPRA